MNDMPSWLGGIKREGKRVNLDLEKRRKKKPNVSCNRRKEEKEEEEKIDILRRRARPSSAGEKFTRRARKEKGGGGSRAGLVRKQKGPGIAFISRKTDPQVRRGTGARKRSGWRFCWEGGGGGGLGSSHEKGRKGGSDSSSINKLSGKEGKGETGKRGDFWERRALPIGEALSFSKEKKRLLYSADS